MSTFENIIKNHWIQFVGLIFMIGSAYARFTIMEHDVEALKDKLELEIEVVEKRLEKKIKLIKELDNRIDELEKCKD